MSLSATNIELKTLVDTISSFTGGDYRLSSLPGGESRIETLKTILSAVIGNSNISYFYLPSSGPDQKKDSEAVNSEEFYTFLMDRVKDSEDYHKLNFLLLQLNLNLGLAQDKFESLTNELVISNLQKPFNSQTPMLTITLNYFIRHPAQLAVLRETIAQYSIPSGGYSHNLKINIQDLSSTESESILSFLNGARFPEKAFEKLVLSFGKVEAEYKTAIELLGQLQNSPIRSLSFEGSFKELPFEQLKCLMLSVLKATWLRGIDCRGQLDHLKDAELLELAQGFKEWDHFSELNFTGILKSKSYEFVSTFIGHLLSLSKIETLALWAGQEQIIPDGWSAKERRDFVRLVAKMLSKVVCLLGSPASSPFAGLVSKQEECDHFCKILKENMKMAYYIFPWLEGFSDEQRCLLAEAYIKGGAMYGVDLAMEKLNLSKNARVRLFISISSVLQIREPGVINFGGTDDSEDMGEFNLDIFDSEHPCRKFIDAWKAAGPLLIDEDSTVDPESSKANMVEKLIPALREASEEYWGDPFYEASLNQIAARAGLVSDRWSVTRWTLLLQWYTWAMCYLTTLKTAGLIQEDHLSGLSPFLKEIAAYADPKMRYILSEALFNLIKDKHNQELFSSLAQKEEERKKLFSSLSKKNKLPKEHIFFLPEIFLCKIMSQDTHDTTEIEGAIEQKGPREQAKAQQAACLKLVEKIRPLLSSKYDDGHYMRSFISALSALSIDRTLSGQQKLQLIHNLLESNPARVDFEKVVKGFCSLLLSALSMDRALSSEKQLELIHKLLESNPARIHFENELEGFFLPLIREKQIRSSVLAAKLIKLLGEHAKTILLLFDRNFNQDKLLEDGDVRSLARGMVDKISELERKKEFQYQISSWYLIEGLSLLKEVAVLAKTPPGEYRKVILKIYQDLFKLGDEHMRYYQSSIGDNRNESAILTYLGKIRSLRKQEDRENLEAIFAGFVRSILTENQAKFYQERYNTSTHLHLKLIFENFPHLKEMWPRNQKTKFNEFLDKHDITSKPVKINYIKFLKNKIYGDNHLKGEDYPDFKQYLNNLTNEKVKLEIEERLKGVLKSLKDKGKDIAENLELGKKGLRALIQLELIQLTDSDGLESDPKKVVGDPKTLGEAETRLELEQKKRIEKIQGHISKLREGREFQSQLTNSDSQVSDPKKVEINQEGEPKTVEEAQKILGSERVKCINRIKKYLSRLREGDEFQKDLSVLSKSIMRIDHPLDLKLSKGWTITFTDHYWDMLMCGTDVEGSCQRVDGDPQLNQCLTAYIWDPKNMMFAIKDGNKIVARRMLRLLWDKIKGQPVLYLEEVYPAFLGSQQEQALQLFAKHVAEDLGLTLVSDHSSEDSVNYPNPLDSLSGVGTPEYVDALHKQMENGIFTIPHSQILFEPRPKPALSAATLHFSWQKTARSEEESKKVKEEDSQGIIIDTKHRAESTMSSASLPPYSVVEELDERDKKGSADRPPILYSQAAPRQKAVTFVGNSEIVKEAQKYREKTSRKGPAYDAFLAKLGFSAADKIQGVKGDRIYVKTASDGKMQWYNIEELYEQTSRSAKQAVRHRMLSVMMGH